MDKARVRDILRGARGPIAAQNAVRQLEAELKRDRSPMGSIAREQFPEIAKVYWPTVVNWPAPDKWITLENVTALNPGDTSTGYRLQFTVGAGVIVGWKGCAVAQSDQSLARSSLKLRITWNTNEELVTNGNTTDYAYFSNLFNDYMPYSPLNIKVTREDIATVYFKNDNTVNTYTPALMFGWFDVQRWNEVVMKSRGR